MAKSVAQLFGQIATASSKISGAMSRVAGSVRSVARSIKDIQEAISKLQDTGSTGKKVVEGIGTGAAGAAAEVAATQGLSRAWSMISGSSATAAASTSAATAATAAAAAPAAATATATASTAAAAGGVLATLTAALPVVLAVGAAAVALYAIWSKLEDVWPGITESIKGFVTWQWSATQTAVSLLNQWTYVKAAVGAATGAVGLVRDGIAAAASLTRDALVGAVNLAAAGWRRLSGFVQSSVSGLSSAARTIATGISTGINKAGEAISWTLGQLSTLGVRLNGIAKQIAGPLADAASDFAAAGDEIHGLAQETGQSAQLMSELSYAADRAGVAVGDVAKAVRMAGSEAKFQAMADEIAAVQDPAARAARAVELFGDAGKDLLPLLSSGPGTLQKFREEADALGLTFSGPAAASAHALARSYQVVKDGLKGLWQTVGQAVAPAITDWNMLIVGAVKGAVQWVRANQPLIASVFSIAEKVALAGTALAAVAGSIGQAVPLVLGITTAAAGGAAVWGRWGESIRRVAGPLIEIFGAIYREAERVFGGMSDAIKGAKLELAAEIAILGVQEAWTRGLLALASATSSGVSGIAQSLAAGDWRGAAQQAWGQIQIAFETGMGALEGLWTELRNTVDGVVTYIRQAWNDALAAIGVQLDRLIAKASRMLAVVASYDPTGTAKEAIGAIQKIGLPSDASANGQLAADLQARQQQRNDALAASQAARDARVTELRQQIAGAGSGAANRAGDRLADIERRLADATKAAADARRRAALPDFEKIKIEDDIKKKREGARTDGTATFSAAALVALGGRGPTRLERIAEQQLVKADAQIEAIKAVERAAKLEFVA